MGKVRNWFTKDKKKPSHHNTQLPSSSSGKLSRIHSIRSLPTSSVSTPPDQLASNDTPPPAYTLATPNTIRPLATPHTPEDTYAFLSTFDTIFLIDDSESMKGRSWQETSAALRTIAPICTAHDADGIDLYFLNTPDSPAYRNITMTATISRIFETVQPRYHTPTGTRLYEILKPYLASVEREGDKVKPRNIIVITDGRPTDDVDSVIIDAAKRLDKADVPAWQVGIQFFQVGDDEEAAKYLRSLDDELGPSHGVRDMVDTVPWNGAGGSGLSANAILKCVLGAVTRRLDRKQNSLEVTR